MKEDVRMRNIRNAVPGGTMPQVGAMQQMQAVPKTAPAQTAPKVSPAQTSPKASPAQTEPKASPAQMEPKVSPAQAMPNVSPAQTMPDMMPMKTDANMGPMQPFQDDMPVLAGPAGMMPSMMNQIPIMCCPYLMNMQCPMLYGANTMGMNMMSNMMPYTGNAGPVAGAANNMYALPSMGAMPPMNNQYFPMGGMDY
jgi:hypothetical protein